MTEDETRSRLTIDFGDKLLSDILDRSKNCGLTPSSLVRRAVSFALSEMSDDILKRTINKRTVSSKEQVRRLVQTYNKVFYNEASPPPQFYPALFRVFNAAVKGGLTFEQLCEIVEAAPYEEFISNSLKGGNVPSLPYILSAGMIPRILVVAHQLRQKQEKLDESDFVEYKYDMLDKYFSSVSPELVDEFRDKLMASENQSQVEHVVKEYAS